MHSFEVHSTESACRKKGRLGLEQFLYHSTILFLVGIDIYPDPLIDIQIGL